MTTKFIVKDEMYIKNQVPLWCRIFGHKIWVWDSKRKIHNWVPQCRRCGYQMAKEIFGEKK